MKNKHPVYCSNCDYGKRIAIVDRNMLIRCSNEHINRELYERDDCEYYKEYSGGYSLWYSVRL